MLIHSQQLVEKKKFYIKKMILSKIKNNKVTHEPLHTGSYLVSDYCTVFARHQDKREHGTVSFLGQRTFGIYVNVPDFPKKGD